MNVGSESISKLIAGELTRVLDKGIKFKEDAANLCRALPGIQEWFETLFPESDGTSEAHQTSCGGLAGRLEAQGGEIKSYQPGELVKSRGQW